jgi:hypothetical protein
MIENKKIAACLCLVMVSIFSLTSVTIWAEDGAARRERPIRLYARACFEPIGTAESQGELTINGRAAYGKQQIWGNELLCAPLGGVATVKVNSICRVTLFGGAIVRITTSLATLDDEISHPVLVASLTRGEMSVKLDQDACGYVEAAGSFVTTSSGAAFRVGVREGIIAIDTTSGNVEVSPLGLQDAPRKMTYGETKPDPVLGSTFLVLPPILDVDARSTRDIQTRVTDANDKPIPDLPVLFAVSAKGVGIFPGGATTFTTTTNAQGIASGPFTAGSSGARGAVTTSVPGTDVSQSIEVNVKKKFWTREKMVAGLAVIPLLIIIADPGPTGPLRQVPPPEIP